MSSDEERAEMEKKVKRGFKAIGIGLIIVAAILIANLIPFLIEAFKEIFGS